MCKHLVQLEPAAESRWGSIVWAVEASGKVPAREFFQALEDRNAAKMQALFNRLADDGFIRNDEKFKKLCNRGGTRCGSSRASSSGSWARSERIGGS